MTSKDCLKRFTKVINMQKLHQASSSFGSENIRKTVVFTVDFDKLKKAMATVEYFAATKDHCAYTRTPLLTEMMAIDLFKHKFHCEWDSNRQAFRINAEYLTVLTLNGTMPDVILSRCFE